MSLILPTSYPILSEQEAVIFLAGPIQGAGNWHTLAIEHLQQQAPEIHIACPKKAYLDGMFIYTEQVDWERFYLNRAAQHGCILFFLANEIEVIEGRSYAQTTRFELGEWKAKQAQLLCNMVVGIDTAFSGARYIKQRLSQDNPTVLVKSTLIETCQAAIELIKSS